MELFHRTLYIIPKQPPSVDGGTWLAAEQDLLSGFDRIGISDIHIRKRGQ